MLTILKNKFSEILNKGNDRSSKIVKNIFLSFIVKGGSIIVGLLLVPMTIDYVNPVQYGIWLTISSIVSWMSFFDVGLGNGLRNSLANAMALGKYKEAKIYVSTTYAGLLFISILLLILFLIVNPLIDWNDFLNIPPGITDNIQNVLLIVLCSFCVQFVAQLINTVLTAMHEPAMAGLISFIGQLGVLVAIFILKKTIPGSLNVLVIALTTIPILVLIIAGIIFYNSKFKKIAPSFNYIDFASIRSILNVGGMFFFVQIGAIVLFQTNNIIITRILGPEYVTEFNVVYKLFSVVTMIFTIIITPYWSAFTDAYARKDYIWMIKNVRLMRIMWFFLSIFAVFVFLIHDFLLKLWVGSSITIDVSLALAVLIYVIVYMWQTLHVFVLNGVGKIKLQLFLVIISAFLNIPFAVFFGKKYGLWAIISTNTLFFVVMGIVFSVQTEKIINQKAKSIWNK